MKRTPLKRSGRIKSRRTKPRPGRLAGADMEALRLACWERDKGQCQECGCYTLWRPRWDGDMLAFDMAHIRNKRAHGDHLSNVRVLCHRCHMLEHSGKKPVPAPPKLECKRCAETITLKQYCMYAGCCLTCAPYAERGI